MTDYILIDPPVSLYDSVLDIKKWIEELKTMPQNNKQVKDALKYANNMLKAKS